MKKFLLLFLSLYLFALPAFAQLEINLSSGKHGGVLLSREYPVVYKPTKLIIGQENIFKVKASPKNIVTLMVSGSNSGANTFYGQTLRLGSNFETVKGVVPENGLLELKFNMPNNKELNGKAVFFEVAVSKDDSFKDIKLAKIMGEDCSETSSNEIAISLPPQDVSKPSLSPMLPMMPPEFARAIDTVEKNKKNKNNNSNNDNEQDYNQYMYDNMYQTPAYIRNLNAPELMNTPR